MVALVTPHSLQGGPLLRRRLRRLRQWMQATITAAATVHDDPALPLAAKAFVPASASRLIPPPRRMPSLDTNRATLQTRLPSLLKQEYPLLEEFLGEESFRKVAALYLREHPPTSYTLNRIGDYLPQFIAERQALPKHRFAADLAQYELQTSAVLNEVESPVAGAKTVEGMPPECWSTLHFQPIAALRSLRLSYPVHQFAQAWKRGENASLPKPHRTYVILYRCDDAVMHMALPAPAFRLFEALAEGDPLGEAIQQMFAAGGCREQDVFQWFKYWFSERLFTHVGVQ